MRPTSQLLYLSLPCYSYLVPSLNGFIPKRCTSIHSTSHIKMHVVRMEIPHRGSLSVSQPQCIYCLSMAYLTRSVQEKSIDRPGVREDSWLGQWHRSLGRKPWLHKHKQKPCMEGEDRLEDCGSEKHPSMLLRCAATWVTSGGRKIDTGKLRLQPAEVRGSGPREIRMAPQQKLGFARIRQSGKRQQRGDG